MYTHTCETPRNLVRPVLVQRQYTQGSREGRCIIIEASGSSTLLLLLLLFVAYASYDTRSGTYVMPFPRYMIQQYSPVYSSSQ